ncbi:MAG: Na/Pi symporter [Acidimicrobiia bacterium]|nr:Na/Pi symporter [Acidimicrobiia bacterium]
MSAPTEEQTTRELPTAVRLLFVMGLLYLFLAGVKALETAIGAFGSDFTEGLLESVQNPIAGLFAGILVTVLVQSSSVSTALIVAAVGNGTITVAFAVPMIMGANIGTTVTNTLASLGSVRRVQEFRRAFAGATMHDFFNLLAVAIFLPLELWTKFLSRSAAALAKFVTGATDLSQVSNPNSPIKTAVKAPITLIEGWIEAFSSSATVMGVVLLVVGLAFIFFALTAITKNMRMVMAGRIERSLNAVLGKGGGITAIIIGILITVSVQSSSITTSMLVPMVAAGVLTLRNAYPVTLGANVGTTVTALIASFAAERPEALVIALVHLLFNVSGILLFYPIPAIRYIPVRLAEGLAEVATKNRSIVAAYVVGVFLILPIAGILLAQ